MTAESSQMIIPQEIEEYLSTLSFRSNNNLKPAGAEVPYTQDMLDEYMKCAKDPIYFIKKYIKVIHVDRGLIPLELYPYQEKMIKAYHENRRVISMLFRQAGKCVGINTKVRLKQKSTNEIIEITLGEFYEWEKFKSQSMEESMQTLQRGI